MFGRILLSQMDRLSRLIFLAFSLPISPKMSKTINSINGYVMNCVLKLKLLKTFLNNSFWFTILNAIFFKDGCDRFFVMLQF